MFNSTLLRAASGLSKSETGNQEDGFTLVEVLVAILVITMFVAVTMQAMVLAAIMKSSAQQYTQGILWIQQDLESLKQTAATYQYTSLSAGALLNASSITVISATDFAANDTLIIGTSATAYTISSISGNTLTISPTLQKDQLSGASVIATTRCQTVASTPTTSAGFAAGLQNKITGSTVTGTSNSVNFSKTISQTNQLFIMTRTTTVDTSSSPYKVLQVDYTVTPTVNGSAVGNPVATVHAEVIPNAAIQCP